MQGARSQSILLDSGTNEVEFLEFSIGVHRFGVNVNKILQAVVFKDLRMYRYPGAHPDYLGVVRIRGKVAPVIDLCKHLKLPVEGRSPSRQMLLMMQFNERTNGFLIDNIEGIQRVSWREFAPLDNFATRKGTSVVVGTIHVEGRIIMILDLEATMGAIDPTMNLAPEIEGSEEVSAEERSRLKIIYAEDSQVIRKMTRRLLTSLGYTDLQIFTTGVAALRHLMDTSSDDVHVIVSDIEMPEMDGLTLCRRLREIDAYKKVPFLFYSSMINEQMSLKCTAVGGNGSFSKPQVHQIIAALDDVVISRR